MIDRAAYRGECQFHSTITSGLARHTTLLLSTSGVTKNRQRELSQLAPCLCNYCVAATYRSRALAMRQP
jgi:hypothetical protein